MNTTNVMTWYITISMDSEMFRTSTEAFIAGDMIEYSPSAKNHKTKILENSPKLPRNFPPNHANTWKAAAIAKGIHGNVFRLRNVWYRLIMET